MAEFRDIKDRVWRPKLTLDAMEAYDRNAEGVGVVEALVTGSGAIYKLHVMIPLLFEAVRVQAEERSVKYEEFRAQFQDSRVMQDAAQALAEAMNEAFPVPEAGAKGDKDRPTTGAGENSENLPPSPE